MSKRLQPYNSSWGALNEALIALPSPFKIVYFPRWTSPLKEKQGDTACEADLIILHPEYGLLACVVEPIREKLIDNTLISPAELTASGEAAIKRAMQLGHALGVYLKQSLSDLAPPYAGCVILPNINMIGRSKFINAEQALIDYKKLKDLPSSLLKIYHLYGRKWSQKEQGFTELLQHLSALSLERADLTADPTLIYRDADFIGRLSSHQARTYELALAGEKRTATYGAAGTGKTEVALSIARRAARDGKRALLLCFNQGLKVMLKRRVEGDLYERGELVVMSVYQLVDELSRALGLQAPSEDLNDHELVADTFFEISRRKDQVSPDRLFDVIVIDEAQDLKVRWLFELIEATLSTPNEGHAHVFYDDRQQLRPGEGWVTTETLKDEGFTFPPALTINYRNTSLIASAAKKVYPGAGEVPQGAPQGQPVSIRTGGLSALQARINDLIRGSVKTADIVVLSPRADGGELSALSLDVPILNSGIEKTAVKRWLKGEGVLLTTPHKFKGLEAKAVFIAGLNGYFLHHDLFNQHALYVSITRGVSLVELFPMDESATDQLNSLLTRL